MKKYKVTVYAICKNEEQNILKWYNSMKEADGTPIPMATVEDLYNYYISR